MVNYNLKEIEGIGPANSRKMQTAKIQTVRGLLKKGGQPGGQTRRDEQGRRQEARQAVARFEAGTGLDRRSEKTSPGRELLRKPTAPCWLGRPL